MMRKRLIFLIPVLFLSFFFACTTQLKAPKQTEAAFAAASSALQPASREYVNETLGFSFDIPASWDTENYSVVVAEKDAGSRYPEGTEVAFLFQDDPDNPLLIIEVAPSVPRDYAKKQMAARRSDPPDVYPLTEVNGSVYSYTLPKSSSYEVGEKSDLYNSMLLPQEEVVNRIKMISSASSVEPKN